VAPSAGDAMVTLGRRFSPLEQETTSSSRTADAADIPERTHFRAPVRTRDGRATGMIIEHRSRARNSIVLIKLTK
jgi:hypothetical protein